LGVAVRRVMHHAILLTVALSALSATPAVAQASLTISSDSKDLSRPVSTLLNQLRECEKILLTYEDPRYSNSSDVEDVTAKIARNPSEALRTGHRTLVPRGKAITFVYAPLDLRTTEGAEAVVARMLQEYRTLGGPSFAVVRDGHRLHVVPADVLDAAGDRVKQGSILDTVITVPPAPRDGGQLLEAVCDELKRQSGYEIGIGSGVPENSLGNYRTTEGFDHISARSAIESILDKSSRPGAFVWDLYYDPGDKSYGLNFGYVGSAGPVAPAQ
jgi:hypothetical protein